MNQFPDNGVKNDGYGSYLQSTVANDDPALKFSRNLVDPNVWNAYFTEEQITAGQAAIVQFIATEGIDSTLHAPHNEDNQQVSKSDDCCPPAPRAASGPRAVGTPAGRP